MTSQYFFNVDHLEWLKTPNDQMTRHICFKSYQMTRNTKLPCDLSLLKFPAILKWPNYLKHHLERPKTPNDQMTTRFSCKCYQMTKNAKLPDDFSFPISLEFLKWPNDLEKLNDPSIFYSQGSLWMTKNTKWPNYYTLSLQMLPND